jgi:anaerobic selenocysteine-containing dehydrogenase
VPPASQSVDPSVSAVPLPLTAHDRSTVCVLCSHNCGLRVDVEGGRIAAVRADETNPITRGYLCNKAFSIRHYVDHAQRVQHPLRRRDDGRFERIPWETAIAEIAERLAAIRERHSPRAIGLVGIGGQANHMDAPFGLTFLGSLGSKRWFNALAQEKTQHFLVDQWMFDAAPATFFHPDVANTRFLLMLGTNPRISNRGHNATDTFRALAEDPTRTVVVVDPRETETTRQADGHLRVRPGSDAYLLLGLAATLASTEGWVDADFVRDRTRDFDALREALAPVDVGEMARRCGLEVAQIVETARQLATAESAAIMFDLAVEQTPFSTLVSYLIHVIATLTGNVGRPGGNVFVESGTPPEWSPARFAEPERALASGIRSVSAMGGFAMFSPTLVPEEVLIDHPERLRALIVEGANPYLSYSDTSRWREARERLDLLVVIEPAMTETAAVADYVLPTPCGYEKWEWAGFPKGHPEVCVQLRPPVVPGPPEALPEPEIYARLAEAMGLVPEPPAKLFELAEHAMEPEGAAALIGELQSASAGSSAAVLFWGYRTLGPRLPAPCLVAIWAQCHANAFARRDSVLRTLGETWRAKTPFEIAHELFRRILDHPEGVEIARVATESNLEDHVGWEDGRIRLAPPEMLDEIARAAACDLPTDPEHPFVLAAGLRTPWTANTIQRDPAWRKGRGPHCALHLSPGDARGLGIASGDRVRISTRRGAVELPAALDPRLQAGHVWIPNGFGAAYPSGPGGTPEVQGANTNELTDVRDRDPITGCPHTKYTLCRLEKVPAPAA